MARAKPRAPSGPLRAVIYARVSTQDQSDEGTSLDTQEQRCRAHAEKAGYRVVRAVREVHTGAELRQRAELGELREPLGMHGRDDAGVVHPPTGLSDDEAMLAVTDRMIDLEIALRRLLAVHDGPCRLDHEGFCQEHYFESPCGVEVARRLLDPEAPR